MDGPGPGGLGAPAAGPCVPSRLLTNAAPLPAPPLRPWSLRAVPLAPGTPGTVPFPSVESCPCQTCAKSVPCLLHEHEMSGAFHSCSGPGGACSVTERAGFMLLLGYVVPQPGQSFWRGDLHFPHSQGTPVCRRPGPASWWLEGCGCRCGSEAPRGRGGAEGRGQAWIRPEPGTGRGFFLSFPPLFWIQGSYSPCSSITFPTKRGFWECPQRQGGDPAPSLQALWVGPRLRPPCSSLLSVLLERRALL